MTLPSTDYTAWRFWLSVGQLLGIILLGLYSWWTNREKVNNKRFSQLKDEVDDKVTRAEAERLIAEHGGQCHLHRRRTDGIAEQTNRLELTVRGLESEVGHLPSATEMQRLNDNIASVSEKLGKLDGRLEGMDRTAMLMNEFLINQGGRK